MILVNFLFGAAFLLATAAGFFSVAGLATTYGGSFAAVVALGSTIELGKLVGVSFLYRFWDKIGVVFKTVMSFMIIGVMVVTSLGVFGYLTKANQTDMVGLRQSMTKIELLADEEQRLVARKAQIDQQIAQLPAESVNSRVRLTRQFKTELDEINKRLPAITEERAATKSAQIEQQADIGPLVFIAKALGYDVDIATTWFTLLLVAVFDPLAVMLTICANIALAHHTQQSRAAPVAFVAAPSAEPPSFVPEPEPSSIEPLQQVVNFQQIVDALERTELAPPKATTETDADSTYEYAAFDGALTPPSHVGPIYRNSSVDHNEPQLDDASKTLMGADWNHYVNRQIKPIDEAAMETKLVQLAQYVAELDQRGSLTEDEVILRSRILNFIERHQPTET